MNSTTEASPNPTDAPKRTAKWKLLADCSHSSAIAVGASSRLAFRKDGLHAFGGYIEGFIPDAFDVEAVCGDDRLISFLQVDGGGVSLFRDKDRFVLMRGESQIRFEGAGAEAMPTLFTCPETELQLPNLKQLEAALDCVPKTGWGALHPDMLGVVISNIGLVSTDNDSLAWGSEQTWPQVRIVLPRPFCLALLSWANSLNKAPKLYADGKSVEAIWDTGERLHGVLPHASDTPMAFDGYTQLMAAQEYIKVPDYLSQILEEAAIFGDDLVVGALIPGSLKLSTPGPVSWERTVRWDSNVRLKDQVLPLKRLRTALLNSEQLCLVEGRIFLQGKGFYVVISTKDAAS